MSRLMLHLLGPFQAVVHEQPVAGFRSDKARALLAYLAIEAARPHARTALAELLWPGYPLSVSRTYLRSALLNLRSILDDQSHEENSACPLLLSTRDTIQLNPAADVWVDVIALSHLLDGLRTPDALEQAVALFRGPFLEGLSVDDSPGFDEWLLFTSEQVNRKALAALQALAALHLKQGRFGAAASSARRQLALDAWDETAHRQLMAALAHEGNRSAALAQYERCCAILSREVGVEPSKETTLLAERIRAGSLEAGWAQAQADSSGAGVAVATAPRTPYSSPAVLARERELAQLQSCMDQALQGAGRVAFVAGGAGSGKTTLLHEFGRRALRRYADVAVAVGRCSDFAGAGDPYLPFSMVLQMLNGDIESPQAATLLSEGHTQRMWAVAPLAAELLADTAPSLLGRLVPAEPFLLRVEAMRVRDDRSLTAGSPTAGASTAGAPAAWHQRLAQWAQRSAATAGTAEPHDLLAAVTHYLHALAQRVPLLLLIDDLQWADAGSVGLLFHLGRQLAGSRILIVAAYRPEAVALGIEGQRALLTTARCELQRITGDVEIDLDRADGQQFVEALLDSEPNRLGAAFRAMLYTHTEGHPLFTVELLHWLCAQGILAQADDGAWILARPAHWQSLPPRVEAIVAERIGQLSSEWRDLLKVASVCGELFSAEVVAPAAMLDEGRVRWALSEPLRRQHRLVQPEGSVHIEPHGQRLSRYRFAHAFFQRYLYDSLDGAERSYLHERVARLLEALYGPSVDEIAARLAQHYEEAGITEKAVHFRQRAGARAVALSAMEEAIAHYSRGLTLLNTVTATPQSAPLHAEQQRALLVALAVPLNVMRGWSGPEATGALTRAGELSRALGGTADPLETVLQIRLHTGRGAPDQALELGHDLLRRLQESGESRALAETHYALGEPLLFRGALAAARTHLEQAFALHGAPSSQPLLLGVDLPVACSTWLAWALWPLGFLDQAKAAAAQALDRARALNTRSTLGFALALAGGMACLQQGDLETARSHAQALLQLRFETASAPYQSFGAVILGLGQIKQGQKEAGLAQLRQGLAAWQAAGTVAGSVNLRLVLVQALRAVGERGQALATIEEAMAIIEQTGLRYSEAELWRQKAELLQSAGLDQAAEVEACLARALAVARAQNARLWELRSTISLCRLRLAQGQPAAALALLAPLNAWFTEGLDTPDLRAARDLLDELARAPQPLPQDA